MEQSTKKSTKRALNKLILILTDLEYREFSLEEKERIFTELDRLELGPKTTKSKKSLKRRLRSFNNYLYKQHSLVCEGYYTALYMAIGMSFGISLGTAMGMAIDPVSGTAIGVSMGIGLGMTFGMLIGMAKDKAALSEGRVINPKS